MPLNDADQEQSQLVNELKLGKVQKRNISNKKSRENAKKTILMYLIHLNEQRNDVGKSHLSYMKTLQIK